ncbi:hypothetical protein BOTBODRAFT_188728 [Botryobasidium botryosum FD-172 SS1]|uniref:Mucoidy inhibitor A n=1 Tax=Botryobasidium botryosum (strain FD-172 SS1) TaxID=930990 RepID=A0A067MCA9_BOTB1|nr:hypothetical protein BOTBODRAFT_188728 [Botryobasidium botryosum FD-172 SS1]
MEAFPDTASLTSTIAPETQTNVVQLVSADVSTITGVSLYGSRAEITRIAKIDLEAGQNRITITGLPSAMLEETLRVEGKGSATIHDVTASRTPTPAAPHSQKPHTAPTSPHLRSLYKKRKGTESEMYRVSKHLEALERFASTFNAKENSIEEVVQAMTRYETEAAWLHERTYDLEQRLLELDDSILEEQSRLRSEADAATAPTVSSELGKQLTVAIFARGKGPVELVLVYAVSSASWRATYETRVVTANSTKDGGAPVDLTYKAAINQSTGEDWADVPIVLETASPTFGLSIPQLVPHTLSVHRPRSRSPDRYEHSRRRRAHYSRSRSISPHRYPHVVTVRAGRSMESHRSHSPPAPQMVAQEAVVTSMGNVTASFSIPGRSNIPSDGEDHQVTIAKLKLEARLQWVAVPSMSLQTHLKGYIENTSEYTFLPGKTSVYLDGSFISKSPVPPVSPRESFECSLGVDPSIRITFHPRTKKAAKSGLYTKTQTHSYSQRITVFNTRTQPVENVAVLAQVPVSQDAAITVKVSSPALPPAADQNQGGSASGSGAPSAVRVSGAVSAAWEDSREGRFKWTAKLAPQEKLMLELEWEVSAPAATVINGL